MPRLTKMAAGQQDGLLEGSPYKTTIVPVQEAPQPQQQSGRSGKRRQYATAIILNIAALAAGTVMGWPSPAGPVLTNATLSPLDNDADGVGEPVSPEHMSWLASVNFLIGLPGTLLFGALADRLGRRVAGLVVAVPYALSWIFIATTDSLLPLYAARLLGGIASGATLVISPLYIAETAEDAHRGALGTFLAVGINSGIFVSFAVSSFTTYRAMPLVLLLLPAVYFLCLLKLPETPVYLVKRGRTAAARHSLAWYRGGAAVDAELETLQAAAKREDSSSDSDTVSFGELFTHRGTRRALIQSLVLLANQQFCGVIAVLNYTEMIFHEAGSSLSPTAAAMIVAALQAVATYLSSFLIDRTGRKTLLIVSNVLMATCLITLGGCFFAQNLGHDISAVGWLPVLAMSLYVVAFAMGLGPVPLVMLSETYSARARSLATAVGIGCQTLCAFVSTKFFLNLQSLLGMHGCLWLFAGCCLAGAAFVALAAIETKGKTLERILAEFHGDLVLPSRTATPDEEAREDDDDDEVFRRNDAPQAP
ncbi:facilitated trehalose transporter Tret1-2 homolog isoform X1 [Frankliniella occidentalis]|uniref:Facilitated trehalose transporter Tret1-2 homolog isoform X1 n=2 Tax=Frankliniella occidentalis TaxID=133901 RepID=A0A6J1T0E6_FRAOC|nr:facilitated trehalose transporter Tret1-2 homolog isoform X1 [Frankliniella occidentalis]